MDMRTAKRRAFGHGAAAAPDKSHVRRKQWKICPGFQRGRKKDRALSVTARSTAADDHSAAAKIGDSKRVPSAGQSRQAPVILEKLR